VQRRISNTGPTSAAVIAVSTLDFDRPTRAPSRSHAVRLGQDMDHLLARTEHDLGRKMNALRADPDRLCRQMTKELQSDTE